MANSELPPLTPAQREIMEIIWREGEATVSGVREALAGQRKLARNTVLTMIVRLEEKGWLEHRQEGRTFIYSARRPRKSSLGARVSQMVDRLFAGSADQMVTALLHHRGLSAEEVDRIRKMIDQAEAKSPGKQKGENKS